MTINGNITIATALSCAVANLSKNKTIDTPRLDSEILLCHILKCDRVFLVVNANNELSKKDCEDFFKLIDRRAKNEPVSYITKVREFMSLDFDVTEGILIPRPDTEILVENIISIFNEKDSKILDLCTGSGAITVSLLYYLKSATCSAVDKYDICIETTLKNAKKHSVDKRLKLYKCDVLDKLDLCDKFDCIVSNPPYIEHNVLSTLSHDVKDYEPMYALDGGDDGLIFYRKITEHAKSLLVSGGILAYEIGYNQADSVTKIIENTKEFKNIRTIQDLAGLNRVIIAEKR